MGMAVACYVLAALGALVCLQDFVMIQRNLRRNAATGDFTGASLGVAFLLTVFLPLTLIALVAALWLHSPGWITRPIGKGDGAPPEGLGPPPPASTASTPRLLVAWALAITAVIVLAIVVALLASALGGAQRDYGLRGLALVALAFQDLILFSPLVVLSGVLFGLAVKIARATSSPPLANRGE